MSLPKLQQPLPPIPSEHEENYAVLPSHNPNLRRLPWRFIISGTLILLLIYLFWPSDPSLKIVRLHLDKLHIHTFPKINIDMSLHFTLQVSNVDVYSMDFESLMVSISYRGKRLGHVKSGEGHVRALSSSYVDAELELSGVGVLSDVVYLLEDLARGRVPLETVTEVVGRFGVLFFELPLKGKIACEVIVNTNNQTIVRQNCYPPQHIGMKMEDDEIQTSAAKAI
ncbi:uncharacterized protein [Euphorbia lathyris]|uniref:uncharacterized protein n=1 Tax=Euphorbia lathyris TaxID=212925 RepID=UPI003314172D